MAKIGLPKGSGKQLKVREKSVKSQGILKWILSGNPEFHTGMVDPRVGIFSDHFFFSHTIQLYHLARYCILLLLAITSISYLI